MKTSQLAYDPTQLKIGQAHIGFGQFFRAHQAHYTEQILDNNFGPWGYSAINLHSAHNVNLFRKQNFKYHVVTEASINTINCIRECFFAKDDFSNIMIRLTSPDTHIITLTITEKGYHFNFSNHTLDLNSSEIKYDLQNLSEPQSAIGLLALSLTERFRTHKAPVTIISCDNVSHNGSVLKTAILDFMNAAHSQASDWVQTTIKFPNTMVDRIVPKLTHAELSARNADLDFPDALAVLTENFSDWVIEDSFAGPRPDWESVGVKVVSDVTPYEHLKLRVLNGSHSILAYFGQLKGHTTVFAAIHDNEIREHVTHYWEHAVKPTLTGIDTETFNSYCARTLSRFMNRNIQHQLSQIAQDGSVKVAQRWLPLLNTTSDRDCDLGLVYLNLSHWLIYILKKLEANQSASDPKFSDLQKAWIPSNRSLDFFLNVCGKLGMLPQTIIDNSQFLKVFHHELKKFS